MFRRDAVFSLLSDLLIWLDMLSGEQLSYIRESIIGAATRLLACKVQCILKDLETISNLSQ